MRFADGRRLDQPALGHSHGMRTVLIIIVVVVAVVLVMGFLRRGKSGRGL